MARGLRADSTQLSGWTNETFAVRLIGAATRRPLAFCQRRSLMRTSSRLVLALACFVWAPAANASLIGDTIKARWSFSGSIGAEQEYLVGAGVEGLWPPDTSITELDVAENSIRVDYLGNLFYGQGEGTVWEFTSLDFPEVITGVSVDTNWWRWDDDFVSFGVDYVRVDFKTSVTFTSTTDFWVATITYGIPEPHAVAILAPTLALAIGCRRPRPLPHKPA